MITTIQKEHTIVYFIPSKILKKSILVSLYGISKSNLSLFVKGNNSITGMMTDLAMFVF